MKNMTDDGLNAITNPTHDQTHDPTRAVVDAVKKSLADLDGCPVGDLTDDVEMAEMIGRLKSLAGVLLSVVDR